MDGRNSKLKLALGAASLFLFLVGLKRSFRTEDGRYIYSSEEMRAEPEPLFPDRMRNAS